MSEPATKADALTKTRAAKIALAGVKAILDELEMYIDFDKYTPEPALLPTTSVAQEAHRERLAAILEGGYLVPKTFKELGKWAWESYSYRYATGQGDKKVLHPLTEDVRSRLGDFTDKQLSELEHILEG